MLSIKINPRYEHLRSFILSIPQRLESEGTTIHDGRNMIKVFTSPDGLQLNVKRYHRPSAFNAVVYSTSLRKPKGLRAYTYPPILAAKGIETPEEVAYIEERNALGMIGFSYFISVQCDYPRRLYEVGNAAPEVYEPLAMALARLAAKMHDAGILHRDFSPGNILWDIRDGEYRFSVVDINRMGFGPVDIKAGCSNFARLWGPKRFVSILVREYARLRGFDPDKAEDITMACRFRFWNKYLRKRSVPFVMEF